MKASEAKPFSLEGYYDTGKALFHGRARKFLRGSRVNLRRLLVSGSLCECVWG